MSSAPEATDTFYILDFDRTLARTDDLRELYESVIAIATPIAVAEIHEARERIKSNFDVSRYVRGQLQSELPASTVDSLMAEIRATFIAKARAQDLLEPYAKELLGYLVDHKLPYGILTAGGKEWQQTKIEAARLEHIPHLIIKTTKKGELIASWRQSDGKFRLPDELTGGKNRIADSLVFIDDKTISFQHLPVEVKGVRVLSVTANEPFEPVTLLPSHVKEVSGLYEVIKYLGFYT